MSAWSTVELKSLVQKARGISYGIVQPGRPVATGVPIVRVSDVRDGRIDTTAPLRVDSAIEDSYKRTRLRGGELLMTIVGTIGETAIVPDDLIGWNVARAIAVLPIESEISAYWVKLALCAPAAAQMIQSHLNTTVQPTLNLGVIAKLPIVLPPRQERERITFILGAYDDLLEVNRRRIAVLEEMARRLFEEWFVHFRFPGYESTAMIETPDGSQPEGWSYDSLYSIADVGFGFPFKSKLFNSDAAGIPVVRIRDILDGHSETWTEEAFDVRYAVENGDLLIGMDGIFHTSVWSGGPAALNQRVTRLRPLSGRATHWLYLSVAPKIKHLEATISGTTVAHLSARDLKAMKVLVPALPVQRQSDALFASIGHSVLNYRLQQRRLAASRDLLLPRLISGELSVSSAERELETVA